MIQVWDGILALPIVGSLDTARTQEMNEALLQQIVDTGSEIVILDITGVPVVDTAVAKHLLETVAAARLLGAEVLIVGLSTRTAHDAGPPRPRPGRRDHPDHDGQGPGARLRAAGAGGRRATGLEAPATARSTERAPEWRASRSSGSATR